MKKIDHAEAVKKGHAEGLEQGSNKKALEIAKKMLDAEMNISDISKFTDLTEAEIENLKTES